MLHVPLLLLCLLVHSRPELKSSLWTNFFYAILFFAGSCIGILAQTLLEDQSIVDFKKNVILSCHGT